MIAKNWPNDDHLNCLGGEESFISTFLSFEENLMENNEISTKK